MLSIPVVKDKGKNITHIWVNGKWKKASPHKKKKTDEFWEGTNIPKEKSRSRTYTSPWLKKLLTFDEAKYMPTVEQTIKSRDEKETENFLKIVYSLGLQDRLGISDEKIIDVLKLK